MIRYFYGFNIVGASFIIQMICYGATFTYGIFLNEFQSEFGWSRAMISGAASISFLIGGALGIAAGKLNDKIGPRVLTMGTSIIFGLGYLLLSWLQSPWQLYLFYGLLVAIGFGAFEVITLSTVARWFMRRRGLMSGVVKMGTGFGQLILPLFAAALISNYGWRNAYLIIGIVFIVVLLSVAQVMRHNPYDIGLWPDNEKHEFSHEVFISNSSGLNLIEALKTKQFWIINSIEFASLFCLLTIVVHIVPHSIDLGLSNKTGAWVISLIGGISMLGRLIMGTTYDRTGSKVSLIICFAMLICSFIWLWFSKEAWMLFLFALIYGIAHGGLFTVISPIVASVFGTRSHGVLFGVILFSGNCASAIGPIVAGHLFDKTESYNSVFLMLILMSLIGLILATQLVPIQIKERERISL